MGMKLKILFTCSVISVLMLCCKTENNDYLTLFVDVDTEASLSLSEITKSLDVVKLELTDSSLISRPRRVICTEKNILVVELKSIMLFDKTGKFIRQIGSIGQGPGEFTGIWDATIDAKNGHIYVIARSLKRICYDFEGNLLKEYSPNSSAPINNIYFVNNELLLLSEVVVAQDGLKRNETYLYTLTPDLQDKDTILIRKINHNGIWIHPYNDYITNDGEHTYLYYSDISKNNFLIDTLFQLKDKKIVANVHMKFKNEGLSMSGEKEIYIYNVYKNSRYVFIQYYYMSKRQDYYYCYDLKTGNSYNMKDGYTDDIYTGENVKIRPLNSDANKFYFLHTKMSDSDIDEPNPTLYIGTLKE